MALAVENSPFNESQVELLNRLLESLTPDQRSWLGGYLAGLRDRLSEGPAGGPAPPEVAGQPRPAAAAEASAEITVLYGSQTGNAAELAGELARRLEDRGFHVALGSMGDFQPRALKKVKRLLVVVSTHGEGDPPDDAIAFHEFLFGPRAPGLEGVGFSVLGLGDLSYEHFCKMGKDFDRRLEELGAERLHPRADCDVDYDEPAEAWMGGVLAALGGEAEPPGAPGGAPSPIASAEPAAAGAPAGPKPSRSRPFQAEVLENLNLNGRGSDKETRHLELSIEGSGLEFEPGDSLGIYPQNHPALVDELIGHMGWNGEQLVPARSGQRPLRAALVKDYELTVLTRPLLEQLAEFSENGLEDLVRRGDDRELRAYLDGRDLLDLARDFPLRQVAAADLVPRLRKLPPRLYSIASSYRANPDEVHVTVAAVRYQAHQRDRHGVCSVQCAERVEPGDTLPVYVHGNPNFRLPADGDAPLIMVGPGTGVAPFRAFLEHREETGAGGKTWLFFGDRRFRTDFLYQVEWQRWLKQGVLTRMDVAFSRDTDRKQYVQHRMMEKSRRLFAWLQQGAYLYVCGDRDRMAPDVHATLETIVEKEGGMSRQRAAEYLTTLQREKRYQRDVY